MHTLSDESKESIRLRKERERMAKIGAERRFEAAKTAEHVRKQRNTIIVMISAFTSLLVWSWGDLEAMAKKHGANPGQILAKSEMTRAEIKALNIIPVKAESRHAVR